MPITLFHVIGFFVALVGASILATLAKRRVESRINAHLGTPPLLTAPRAEIVGIAIGALTFAALLVLFVWLGEARLS